MNKTIVNAIQLIKGDHRVVDGLFSKFKVASTPAERKTLANQIVKELSVHAAIEEEVLYPAIRKAISGQVADHCIDEHQKLKELLYDIDQMNGDHPQFVTKMNTVIQETTHHVKEEEESILPKFQSKVSPKELEELGSQLQSAKAHAPTRPHPMAPNKPPLNIPLNMGTAPIDKLRDAAEGRK